MVVCRRPGIGRCEGSSPSGRLLGRVPASWQAGFLDPKKFKNGAAALSGAGMASSCRKERRVSFHQALRNTPGGVSP
jgi:hypothetical protein